MIHFFAFGARCLTSGGRNAVPTEFGVALPRFAIVFATGERFLPAIDWINSVVVVVGISGGATPGKKEQS